MIGLATLVRTHFKTRRPIAMISTSSKALQHDDFNFQSRAIVTISIPSMALNLDNNFKVSARKQHELPGNQRVLSQRIGHKQHPRARPI
jgi:hypothetical protein